MNPEFLETLLEWLHRGGHQALAAEPRETR
jgi:hypothetical protein